jgi:hypothetical protein
VLGCYLGTGTSDEEVEEEEREVRRVNEERVRVAWRVVRWREEMAWAGPAHIAFGDPK